MHPSTPTPIPPSENKPSRHPPNGSILSKNFQSKKKAGSPPSIKAYPLHFLSDDLGICRRNSVVTDVRSSSISVCRHLAGTFLVATDEGIPRVFLLFWENYMFFQAGFRKIQKKKHQKTLCLICAWIFVSPKSAMARERKKPPKGPDHHLRDTLP